MRSIQFNSGIGINYLKQKLIGIEKFGIETFGIEISYKTI